MPSPPPDRFTAAELAAAFDTVTGRWSAPSLFSQTKVHHGYRQVSVMVAGRWQIEALDWMVDRFAPALNVWMSRLEPGGYIVEHIDEGPYLERWQVPFTTAGTLLHDGVPVPHEAGVPFRVAQFDWHSVSNDSNVDRVSLVIDRNIPLDVPSGRFRVR